MSWFCSQRGMEIRLHSLSCALMSHFSICIGPILAFLQWITPDYSKYMQWIYIVNIRWIYIVNNIYNEYTFMVFIKINALVLKDTSFQWGMLPNSCGKLWRTYKVTILCTPVLQRLPASIRKSAKFPFSYSGKACDHIKHKKKCSRANTARYSRTVHTISPCLLLF